MFRSLTRLFSVPDKLAMLGLVRGMRWQIRLMTASALLRCGAMPHLSRPRTLEDLADATGATEVELLRHLLDLGVQMGLLRRRRDLYSARSALARCLARPGERPIASMLLEVTSYHADVFQRLPERLQGEPPRDYLERHGALVAQSSRIMDPWLCAFARGIVGERRGRRILDIGCGSGHFLAFCASLHGEHHGVGLELDERAAAAATRHLAEAGCADRFTVRQGDARTDECWPEQPFDVITAHQNVYYFDAAERAELWRRCRDRLPEDGRLAIATPTSGGPLSDYFSLILLSSVGCHRLPSVDELTSELRAAGFSRVRKERLIPGDEVWGIEASGRTDVE